MTADTLSLVFSALADPTRRNMVARLAQGDATVGQLAEPYQMTLQAVYKHLRVLELAGIVHCVRSGRESRFGLDPRPLNELQEYLSRVSEQWDQALARLKALVES